MTQLHTSSHETSSVMGASSEAHKNYLYLDPSSPEAQEFDCDAAEAMTYLGIKRSRLTQISGQSLVCARIKVDRYTRPMYRWSDVKAYHEQSKARVSYSKSTAVLETATQSLETKIAELETTLYQLQLSISEFKHQINNPTLSHKMAALTNHITHPKDHPTPSQMTSQPYQAGSLKGQISSPTTGIDLIHAISRTYL